MREKYESLALAQLKELAKVRGLKGTSTMKKAEIVEAMLAEDERQKSLAAASSAPQSPAQSMPQSTAQTAAQNQAQNQGVSKGNVAVAPQGSYQQEQASPQAVRNETRYTTRGDAQAEARTEAYTKTESKERNYRANEVYDENQYPKELDSGVEASGILEVMPDGYGFIRCENYLPGENDVYVAPSQIRRFGLKTGDILRGNKRIKTQQEKFSALLFIRTINGYTVEEALKRKAFEDMTPIFPDERIKLETPGCSVAMRVMDLVSPVGKGQRGMIVSPPKAGKTTLLKEVAKSILRTNPQMHMLILLIDERPEEVTDIREAIVGENVEVIYSTFDELPEHHKRVSEMVIERAKRLVEH